MREYTVNDIDSMPGHDFEYFCAEILRKNGYSSVRVTRGSGDYGIDILASKDGIKYGIQCKRFANNVGFKAVQEAYAGIAYYKCDKAMVMTNSNFTKQAREFSDKVGVILCDRDKLLKMSRVLSNNPISKVSLALQPKNQNRKARIRGVVAIISLLVLFSGLIGNTKQHDIVNDSTELPKSAPVIKTNLSEKRIVYQKYTENASQISVFNKCKSNICVTLSDKYDVDYLTFLVASGEEELIECPSATYTVKVAKGEEWIDLENYFGDETEFEELKDKLIVPWGETIELVVD